jgi:hypothetical protein
MPPRGQNPGQDSHSAENRRPATVDAGGPEEQRLAGLNDEDDALHMTISPVRTRINTAMDDLHPFTQILSVSHAEDCVKVEDGAFRPHERCSREKVCFRDSISPMTSID